MVTAKKPAQEEFDDLRLQLELQVEELNRAQIEVEESRRMYYELFDLAPFAYFTLDKQGMILSVNRSGLELLGEQTRGRLMMRRFGDYVVPEHQSVWYEFRREVCRAQGRVRQEITVVRKDGVRLQAQIDGMMERTGGAKTARIWMVVSDISAWKKAEEVLRHDKEMVDRIVSQKTAQLLSSQDQLAKAGRLVDIGTLAATIAHELRNPLAAIKMASYNIKRKKPSQPQLQHIETIDKKVDESEQIITNLLFYSRLKQPVFEMLDISRLIDETVSFTSSRIDEKQIKVKQDLKALGRVRIAGDALQLKEVYHNILNNAFDAVGKKTGAVVISGKREEKNWVVVRVRDNGPGIDKENMGNLFKPFFTTKSKGTGLGLTVSKEIVNMHNGDIFIESEKGKGTMVSIRLPIEQPAA
jgi:PAS domain S-box-containing protein